MGLGYVVTGILYRGLCPDALNDPEMLPWITKHPTNSVVLENLEKCARLL